MIKWLKNIMTHGLSKKALLAVFVIASIDVLSMAAPYYLKYVMPNIWTYLHVSQGEFDQISAVMGYIVIAMELPSGWLADRFSGRKLLITSVLMTGVLTVLFGLAAMGIFSTSIAVPMLYIIFAGFGVSVTLFLWSPLWKVLSEQGSSKEQGSLYGLQGSYNGLIGLLLITGLGTGATYMAENGGNNILFYILVFTMAAGLFLSALGTFLFVEEKNQKSALALKAGVVRDKVKAKFAKDHIKGVLVAALQPLKSARVWMTAFFVMGMYMFQSVFAYYMGNYMALFIPAILATVIQGFRTYGLRLIVSSPFGAWFNKRRSFVLVMVVTLGIGAAIAAIFIMLPGFGNTNPTGGYALFLKIMLPILVIFIGITSWALVAGRYAQISEIPHTKANYGTVIAVISLVAFSTDAWFYQMASSWMKSGGYITDGSYSQAGIQLLMIVALSLAIFGMLCGLGVYLWNKAEIKKLGKVSYKWRDEEAEKATKSTNAK